MYQPLSESPKEGISIEGDGIDRHFLFRLIKEGDPSAGADLQVAFRTRTLIIIDIEQKELTRLKC